MAKLMSKKTRETVKTVVFLVVFLILLGLYVIYPLVIIDDIASRRDLPTDSDTTSGQLNDPSFFISQGLAPDTITVNTRDNLNLAALYFSPDSVRFPRVRGTLFLLHPDDTDRTFLAPLVQPLINKGLAVVVYDQRASGLSPGKWHGAGLYEADDLADIMAELNVHGQLVSPVVAVGFESGADAAYSASLDEARLNGVVAVRPHLSSSRWISTRLKRLNAWPIPFRGWVLHWWFKTMADFPFERTTSEDIRPAACPTVLMAAADEMENNEIERLIENSEPGKLAIQVIPGDPALLTERIIILADSLAKLPISGK